MSSCRVLVQLAFPFLYIAVLALSAGPGAAQTYDVVQLHPAGGVARAISVDGVAVGEGSRTLRFPGPMAWPLAGGGTELPLLPDDENGGAYGVGLDGTIAGESNDVISFGGGTGITSRAAIWRNGQVIEVSSLVNGGAMYMQLLRALGTDQRGRVMGWARIPAQRQGRGFVLETDGTLVDIGSLAGPGTGNNRPFAWNEQGVIVGEELVAGGFEHAFRWQDGVMVDLHDPSIILGRNSAAWDINEAGWIVGDADYVDDLLDFETATLWRNGVPQNLGTLGGQISTARGINEHGDVVGVSIDAVGQARAFLWRDGAMTDLNALIPPGSGWVLRSANAISDDGRIVGAGYFQGVGPQPYALVPRCPGALFRFGTGCAASANLLPRYAVAGCPRSGGELSLAIVNGGGGAPGLLVLGTVRTPIVLPGGCQLDILPAALLPVVLSGSGPGAGTWIQRLSLPRGLAATTVGTQVVLVDPVAGTLTVTDGVDLVFS